MIDDNKLKEMMTTIGELMRRSMLKRPDSDAAFGEGAMMIYALWRNLSFSVR